MSATSLPLSAQELCESVRAGRPLEAARLDRMLGVDSERGVVEVQAGARWNTLAARLRPDDDRTRDLSSMLYSIGRSLALNAAGPDGRPTVSHVESFTLVTPDGSLKRVDRVSNAALFSLVVGGQGLFGALYSVRLRIDSLARAVAEARSPQTLVQSEAPKARRLILLVPPAALEPLISECRERCSELRVALESLQVRPTRAEEETYLRWARREYAEVSLGLGSAGTTLGAEVRHTQLRRSLIDLAIERGGGFPISCTPEATRAQTEACYPQLAGFLAEQRRVDPQGRWTTAWLRHHRSLLTRQPCEVRFS
jgi:FAD/FMN-containing dehydrogenase